MLLLFNNVENIKRIIKNLKIDRIKKIGIRIKCYLK